MRRSSPAKSSKTGAHRTPQSHRELFTAFTVIALQGFGGVLSVIQRELVERKQWMGHGEFLETWGIAQILPGANIVNLSLILGYRYLGFTGALAALVGLLFMPLLIMTALLTVLSNMPESATLDNALRGMGAVAAGMVAGTGLKMLPHLRKNVMGIGICAVLGLAVFTAVGLFGLSLIKVIAFCAIPAAFWAHAKMRSKTA